MRKSGTTMNILLITFFVVCISCNYSDSEQYQPGANEYFVMPCEFACDYPYNDTTKWEITCRVWGLLKYYHPNVTEGKLDWDQVLLEGLENIDRATTVEVVNSELKRMLEKAGKYRYRKNKEFSDSLKMNMSLCWLEHSFFGR